MKPVSAHVHQLAGRVMRAPVEKLCDGLIAPAKGTERVDSQQRVDNPAACATVQILVSANGGRSDEPNEERRPHPSKHLEGAAVRREHDESGASRRQEARGQGGPSL